MCVCVCAHTRAHVELTEVLPVVCILREYMCPELCDPELGKVWLGYLFLIFQKQKIGDQVYML